MPRVLVDRMNFSKSFQCREEPGARVDIRLTIPPSYIPYFLSGDYCKQGDMFQVEFNYLDDEEARKDFQNDRFEIYIGKHTQRVLKINVLGVKRNKVSSVNLTHVIQEEVREKISEYKDNTSVSAAKMNYSGINELLQDKAKDISVLAV